MKATKCYKFHQRFIGALVEDDEPDGASDERQDKNRAFERGFKGKNTGHGYLEDDNADDNANAYDRPCFSSGMLTMIHSVEKLIFIREASDHEID